MPVFKEFADTKRDHFMSSRTRNTFYICSGVQTLEKKLIKITLNSLTLDGGQKKNSRENLKS